MSKSTIVQSAIQLNRKLEQASNDRDFQRLEELYVSAYTLLTSAIQKCDSLKEVQIISAIIQNGVEREE